MSLHTLQTALKYYSHTSKSRSELDFLSWQPTPYHIHHLTHIKIIMHIAIYRLVTVIVNIGIDTDIILILISV